MPCAEGIGYKFIALVLSVHLPSFQDFSDNYRGYIDSSSKASSTSISVVNSYYLLNSAVPTTFFKKDAFSIATLMRMMMEVVPDTASGPWKKVPLLENFLL